MVRQRERVSEGEEKKKEKKKKKEKGKKNEEKRKEGVKVVRSDVIKRGVPRVIN